VASQDALPGHERGLRGGRDASRPEEVAARGDLGATYVSLGAAIGLLFYLYLSAAVVPAGAEVNSVLYYHVLDEQSGKEEVG
jgi:hypothetical protein